MPTSKPVVSNRTQARPFLPPEGIRATQCGGNTVGALLREASPRADGYRHLDTPAMIAKLEALGVNTYVYGIWDAACDWDDLRLEFAPAAQAVGIDIWIYLVPPSETSGDGGRASRPYMTDYLAWATACGELAAQYPNVKAWGIDDFEFNQDVFTPDYVGQMRKLSRAHSPELGFYLCTYYSAATSPEFMTKYAPHLDCVLYPFLDGDNLNTQVADNLRADLDNIIETVRPWDLGIVLLVYTGRFLASWWEPRPQYNSECVRVGLEYTAAGKLDGVTAYGLQLDDAPTPASSNRAMYGNGRLSLIVPPNGAPDGAWAQASQTVRIDPAMPRYELSFWHREDAITAQIGSGGQNIKQVLVDDEVVWSEDAGDGLFPMWQQCSCLHGPLDLTEHLVGKRTATLAFRLQTHVGERAYPIDVGFDHIETIGFSVSDPGFETGQGWTLTKSAGRPLVAIDRFEPDFPRRNFEAVAAVFNQYR